jgi:transposase
LWTVLDAVAELDLAAIYGDYRDDGRGRPAYEPSMMVALLVYACARGNRSSRGIERVCVEDIAYRVLTGNLAPDHSTIAEFRCRHEQPLGEVFSGVLGLCARAGLVSVGTVAIDGTKIAANASSEANRNFGQIAREILAEAAEHRRARGRTAWRRARRRAARAFAYPRGPAQGAARGQGAPGPRARPVVRGTG